VIEVPFPYFGGKRRIAHLVWERFGDVPNYVEPFAGSLAVLLARPHPPRTETVNDADCMVANFWRAVQRDPEAVARWADWPVNEADLHARHRWLVGRKPDLAERVMADPDHYDAQAAGWWVWGICQWIGNGWCATPDRRRPHLSNGAGVHQKLASTSGNAQRVVRQITRAGGMGVHKQIPHLGIGGCGVLRTGVVVDGGGGRCADRTAALLAWFGALRDRLRDVRVCCGDWSRVLGPTPTTLLGTTAVFLDPPYAWDQRDTRLYNVDESGVADRVRAWAVAHGDDPQLRIALCGYEGEHDMPPGWIQVRWKARGGYGNQGNGRARANADREVIWFSPHCLQPSRPHQAALPLDDGEEDVA
jgi:hypothetical protein